MYGMTNAGGGGGATKGVPKFTYTGSAEVINEDEKGKNWRINFLTSGTFTVLKLNGAKNNPVDVWLCGGGGGGGSYSDVSRCGGGGGGGYTKQTSLQLEEGVPYAITIGAGGGYATGTRKAGGSGGTTSGFSTSAAGGRGAGADSTLDTRACVGGAGGSGGGSGNGGKGGSNGASGGKDTGGSSNYPGGQGAGVNTHQFKDNSLPICCAGGSACAYSGTVPGAADASGGASGVKPPANRGGGGGGGGRSGYSGNAGASGVVCIRNNRF